MALQSDKLRLLRRIPEIRFEEELRGYSKQQVDRVLENLAPLADEIETLQNRLAEAETRAAAAEARMLENGGRESDLAPQPVPVPVLPATPADFDETLRNTLLLAQRTADETVKRANEDAVRITAEAETGADQMLAAARAEAAQLEADIHARRAELLADADAERHELLQEIRSAAEARRAAIEQELTQTEGAERAELLSQIEDLQGIRSMLVDDVEVLESHLGARREAVRSALDEIAAVLDEPDRLRSQPFPDLSVSDDPPTAVRNTPVEVAAPLLDELVAEPSGPSESPSRSGGPSTGDALDDRGVVDRGVADRSVADRDQGGSGPRAYGSAFDETGERGDPADEGFVFDASPDALAAPVFADSDLDAGTDLDAGPATQQISALDVDPWADSDDTESTAGSTSRPTGSSPARPVSRPTWADAVPDVDELPVDASVVSTVGVGAGSGSPGATPPPPAVQDPFLDQLRRATSEEGGSDDDALDRFLEGDPDADRRGGGWFGRRK